MAGNPSKAACPAVDVTETDNAYQIAAELPEERERRKKRATTCENVASAHFNGPSRCPRASIQTRSRPASSKGC
jgi:hypothetical protein